MSDWDGRRWELESGCDESTWVQMQRQGALVSSQPSQLLYTDHLRPSFPRPSDAPWPLAAYRRYASLDHLNLQANLPAPTEPLPT